MNTEKIEAYSTGGLAVISFAGACIGMGMLFFPPLIIPGLWILGSSMVSLIIFGACFSRKLEDLKYYKKFNEDKTSLDLKSDKETTTSNNISSQQSTEDKTNVVSIKKVTSYKEQLKHFLFRKKEENKEKITDENPKNKSETIYSL